MPSSQRKQQALYIMNHPYEYMICEICGCIIPKESPSFSLTEKEINKSEKYQTIKDIESFFQKAIEHKIPTLFCAHCKGYKFNTSTTIIIKQAAIMMERKPLSITPEDWL